MSIETQQPVESQTRPADTDRSVQLKCYRSFDEVRSLADSWDTFVERVGGDLYTSFDWCETWWNHFGRGRQLELYIATVNEEIVAILPLFREKISWGIVSLRVIRILGCDHCVTTCNVAIEAESTEPVAKLLMQELNDNGRWDLIHLGELPTYDGNAKTLAQVLQRCPQAGEVCYSDDDYPHMVFHLPDNYEVYLATLGVKERRNVRRDDRQLEKTGSVEYVIPTDEKQLEQSFGDLVETHASQWKHQGRLGHFGDWPGITAFHRDVATKSLSIDRLSLVDVRVDGASIASEYAAIFGKRAHWIIGARTRGTSSRIGFCTLAKSLLQQGIHEIDALPGEYDYKRRLNAETGSVKTITVTPSRNRSRFKRKLFVLITKMVDLFYYRVWYWRIAPWIRRNGPAPISKLFNKGICRCLIHTRFLVAAKAQTSDLAESQREND